MEPVAWLAAILFVALLVGAWYLARRSEEHNEYIDETHHREPRDPPISGTGFLG